MFVGITNTPRDYAWGSAGAISALLGTEPSGGPEAELWLGAHPGSPSRVVDPSQVGGAATLEDWIASDPDRALGAHPAGEPRLPFLLKVLAAASPLSLQAHPTAQQAIAGFAREHAEGIPIDAPDRNYRDAFPKPEILYALSETVEALCGFHSSERLRELIERLIDLEAELAGPASEPLRGWLNRAVDDDSLHDVFEWLISKGPGVRELINRVVAIVRANPEEFDTVVLLADAYPGDPGIVISLMLHHVVLERGEALYLPAGNPHAYISGVGVELMTASDNVLRGGLTPKHVDVDELLHVLDFTPGPAPYLPSKPLGANALVFRPPGVDFELIAIEGPTILELHGPAIMICEAGEFQITGKASSSRLSAGQSVYVTPDELELAFEGAGSLFVGTTGH
ncbi:MAG: manA [Rhodoglobus sp.]|nr:manA [Rhodoglobus sp.]